MPCKIRELKADLRRAGCASHGTTYAEAARQGQDAIETWIATARAYGDAIPAPRVRAWRDELGALPSAEAARP